MGEVWRAYDTAIDRVVALKVLPANFADDEVYQERFRREAHAAAGLNEPHVIPIHDFGEIDGRLYVTMRLIEGRDLGSILAEGPLEPARAIRIIDQIASALHAGHRIGLVHRDVKPSNILVTEDDFAYLIDFGIARAAGETGLTSTGATIGTWAYMAPERFRTGTADPRSDIYALACVLYQSLTGELPFAVKSLEQIAVAHMFEPPPQPSARQEAVPAAMDEVIATGMAKEPDQRQATTKDLAQAARSALIPPTRQPGPPPPMVGAPRSTLSPVEPPPHRDNAVSDSSTTADDQSGSSSPEVAAKATAGGLPSQAPEAAVDAAADFLTRAEPTVSASSAPTQQSPLSAGKEVDQILHRPRTTSSTAKPVRKSTAPRQQRPTTSFPKPRLQRPAKPKPVDGQAASGTSRSTSDWWDWFWLGVAGLGMIMAIIAVVLIVTG